MTWMIRRQTEGSLQVSLSADLEEAKAYCSFRGSILGDDIYSYEWKWISKAGLPHLEFWGCYVKTKSYRNALTKSHYPGNYPLWTISLAGSIEDSPEWINNKIKDLVI
jgi:hypothetical protein